MSLYVLMRLLESAPHRYDLGIRLLTFGQLNRVYGRLAHYINKGDHVLDVGCGTGSLSLHAARRGARVKGIDIDARMLEIAKERARREGMAGAIDFIEMGVAELDAESAESYDVVVSGLCFSELSHDEIAFTLAQAKRILRPGGLLLLADEIRPEGWILPLIYWLIRIPLVVLVYLFTQQTTHPLRHLSQRVAEAGFTILSHRTNVFGSFVELVAKC